MLPEYGFRHSGHATDLIYFALILPLQREPKSRFSKVFEYQVRVL